MSKIKWPADGKITSGRGIGDYVYCLDDVDYYPMRLKFERIIKDISILIPRTIYSDMYGNYLFDNIGDAKKYFSFTPQTVAKIEILASTSTGPSASDFVAGTLLGGVALGAAAAMTTVGSQHTVKVTWRDDHDSKESIITFNNCTGFQTFIGKLGSLINQPNEATPAISSPVTSSADEILKFKKLMDEGIITQAEFEAKKKQLLGIENTVVNSSEADNARIKAKKADDARKKGAGKVMIKMLSSDFGGRCKVYDMNGRVRWEGKIGEVAEFWINQPTRVGVGFALGNNDVESLDEVPDACRATVKVGEKWEMIVESHSLWSGMKCKLIRVGSINAAADARKKEERR